MSFAVDTFCRAPPRTTSAHSGETPPMDRDDHRLPARFWAKVGPTTASGCWPWIGAISTSGYGQISWPGFNKTRRVVRAHRLARAILAGDVPISSRDPILDTLDHLCRNTVCVNPAHLEPASLRQNIQRGVPHNSKKTRCGTCGGPYTHIDADGRRKCRPCHRRANQRYYHRNKASKRSRKWS